MLHKVIYSLWRQLYFLPIIWHNAACRKNLLKPVYNRLDISRKKSLRFHDKEEKYIIYAVLPETTFSGGLSDRLRGIVSVYKECRQRGLPFKIYFGNMNLTDYLLPNQYDWRLKEGEFDFNILTSYPCTVLTHHRNLKNPVQKLAQLTILRRHFKKDYRQIHVYTNMATADKEYGNLFKELFTPTKELQEHINFHLKQLGGKKTYDAVVFRFRQLLGDFKEGGETLDETEKESYLNRCIERVKSMHATHTDRKLLVTSDSTTFLNEVNKLPFVYIIPGEVVHMGFTYDASKLTYMKSFIDYFMLSYASKVTLIRDKKMYHSGFAYRATLLNEADYSEIWL